MIVHSRHRLAYFRWFMRISFRCFWLMVLVSIKMRNQISISAITQFMNSVLRNKLTSAKRSESTVFELVFPDIEDIHFFLDFALRSASTAAENTCSRACRWVVPAVVQERYLVLLAPHSTAMSAANRHRQPNPATQHDVHP